MTRSLWTQLIALMCALACVAASTGLTTRIAASAGRHRLTYTDRAEDGAPTEQALGIAFGAFRGVFVNFLWIRANQLKQDGKFYECIDLAETITKLQPRYPRVWAFHAWNLSYNISVATQTQEERWQWVKSGIDLLRQKGIPANPSDLILHRELAWIFLHKVQGFLDDAGNYYRRELAKEWTYVVGAPPIRTFSASQDATAERTREFAEHMRSIVTAPNTMEEVIAEQPKAQVVIDALKQLNIDISVHDGKMFFLRAFEEAAVLPRLNDELKLNMRLPSESLVGLMMNPDLADAGLLLIRHLRKRIIIDYYHMEPERMLRYTEKFGPLDWRLAASHAVYWATRGVEESALRMHAQNRKDFDIINTDRMCVQAVQELFRGGDLFFDLSNPDCYVQMQNVDFLNIYGQIAREHRDRELKEYKDTKNVDAGKRVFTPLAAGWENFLRDAIRFLYRRGEVQRAEEYLGMLRRAEWLNQNNPFSDLDLQKPVREFVVNEVITDDQFTRPAVAMQEIEGALQSAFINGLRVGDMDLYNSNMDYARAFHERYCKEKIFNTGVNQGDEARMELFPRYFDEYAGTILTAMINFAREENGGVVMYQRAPQWLQQATYVLLVQTVIKQRLAAQLLHGEQDVNAFDTWFPEPPGLDVYRAELARRHANEVQGGNVQEQ